MFGLYKNILVYVDVVYKYLFDKFYHWLATPVQNKLWYKVALLVQPSLILPQGYI